MALRSSQFDSLSPRPTQILQMAQDLDSRFGLHLQARLAQALNEVHVQVAQVLAQLRRVMRVQRAGKFLYDIHHATYCLTFGCVVLAFYGNFGRVGMANGAIVQCDK
jgi:hypothetical protein